MTVDERKRGVGDELPTEDGAIRAADDNLLGNELTTVGVSMDNLAVGITPGNTRGSPPGPSRCRCGDCEKRFTRPKHKRVHNGGAA